MTNNEEIIGKKLTTEEHLKNAEKAAVTFCLTEYIKMLSDAELIDLKNIIIADDITGVRVNIMDVILQEIEYRKNYSIDLNGICVSDLDKAYDNGTLMELLSMQSTEKLLELKRSIFCDDIIGIRVDILNILQSEILSRYNQVMQTMQTMKKI